MDQNQDGGGNSGPLSNNVVVLLLAMGSAAFVVSVYHIIAICCCHQHITDQNQQQQQQIQPQGGSEQSTISSVAHMIPSHKYHKRKVGNGDGDGDDDGGGGGGGTSTTCAVCLGDFEEGEELKTLPECIHSFHVACIDMWLHSHTSCPICRASATPSPAGLHHGPFQGFDHSGGDSNANHSSIDMVQISAVQNGLVRR